MNRNCLFVCLFVCLNVLISQEEPELAPPVEFFFKSINTTQNLTFSASAMSIVFDNLTSGVYPVTTNYNSSQYTYVPPSEPAGWHFVNSQNHPEFPVVAFGLYKFYYNNNFFYLDLRDQRLDIGSIYTQVDIWFTFDSISGTFSYSNYGYGDPNPISISNGDYLTIWSLKGKGAPSFQGFQNYSWSNCLSIKSAIHPIDGYPAPMLIWGPNPNLTASGYKIYRRLHPNEQQFTLIAQTSNTQFVFNDYSLTTGGNSTIAYYKIKAYNNEEESTFSNEAGIYVDTNPAKRENVNFNKHLLPSFYLYQNYPNPFNPTTKIRYFLPEPSHVKIVVMNTVGQEVKTLVNTHQNEGEHSVTFNASELPSGVYFYAVYAGNFRNIKKMIYLR